MSNVSPLTHFILFLHFIHISPSSQKNKNPTKPIISFSSLKLVHVPLSSPPIFLHDHHWHQRRFNFLLTHSRFNFLLPHLGSYSSLITTKFPLLSLYRPSPPHCTGSVSTTTMSKGKRSRSPSHIPLSRNPLKSPPGSVETKKNPSLKKLSSL